MSTRCTIEFKDSDGKIAATIYQHHDGYPAGVNAGVHRTLAKAWPLPRYEADEFAAAYVAANKPGAGSIRISKGTRYHGDLEYVHIVSPMLGGGIAVNSYLIDYSPETGRISRRVHTTRSQFRPE